MWGMGGNKFSKLVLKTRVLGLFIESLSPRPSKMVLVKRLLRLGCRAPEPLLPSGCVDELFWLLRVRWALSRLPMPLAMRRSVLLTFESLVSLCLDCGFGFEFELEFCCVTLAAPLACEPWPSSTCVWAGCLLAEAVDELVLVVVVEVVLALALSIISLLLLSRWSVEESKCDCLVLAMYRSSIEREPEERLLCSGA